MPDEPSNTKAANRADPVSYWKQGRATCPSCRTVRGYVARIDVEDLRCDCGQICRPAHEEESEERR